MSNPTANDTSNATGRTDEPLAWDDLVAVVQAAGEGVFLATTGHDGRPHVAFVQPGWGDERMWISTFASSQKATNLRRRPEVAMTCTATPETNVLIRGTVRLVDDPAETTRLWNDGVLPYDPGAFFSGPEDPQAQFVEIRPTSASIHPLGPGPTRRWSVAPSAPPSEPAL